MKKPLVSVIVTTRNSENHIENCLQSIRDQKYSPVEIIIVDNNSSDKTVKIAAKYSKKIFIHGPERSAQRNFGFKKSKGMYILILDSDMILSKNVISECVRVITKDNIYGIYIPEKIIGNSFFAKIRNFERSFYNGTVVDAVRFVCASDYKKVNGFDESLYAGEDWDFDKRIRKLGKTSIISASLYHDESHSSVLQYVSKKAYYSPNLEKYKHKWKNDKEVQKQFSLLYRYFGVFIENGKWKKLITNLHLTLPMFFLRFVVGLTYLLSRRNEKKT